MSNTTPRPGNTSRICPTCGTRLAETASRCAVCGTEFAGGASRPASTARISGSTSSINLPLGLVIAGPIFFLLTGALIVTLIARTIGLPFGATATPKPSASPTITNTPPPTASETPTPTFTPLPDIEITVAPLDTCLKYAAIYKVPVNLITDLNDLLPDCTNLRPGQTIRIPQPTATTAPPAVALSNAETQTAIACTIMEYKVVPNDTLAGIARYWNVSIETLKRWNNNIYGETVFAGLTLKIPLCEQLPTAGPSPTPTTPPPYPAPNLLSPRDGTVFSLDEEAIALQWAAVATLRENEQYQITIEDISTGGGEKWVDYTTDTRYIVPASLRPTDSSVHLYRWTVMVVRQVGTTDAGKPIFTPAGAISDRRVFAWGGSSPDVVTPTIES